jgi:hypothetical protein
LFIPTSISMKTLSMLLFCLGATLFSLQAQNLRLYADAYGSVMPFVEQGLLTESHVSVGYGLAGKVGLGLAFSHWRNKQNDFWGNYTGLGLSCRYTPGPLLIKSELGALLQYERGDDIQYFYKNQGAFSPYLRAHLGVRFLRLLTAGVVLGWVPEVDGQEEGLTYDPNQGAQWLPVGPRSESRTSLRLFVGIAWR